MPLDFEADGGAGETGCLLSSSVFAFLLGCSSSSLAEGSELPPAAGDKDELAGGCLVGGHCSREGENSAYRASWSHQSLLQSTCGCPCPELTPFSLKLWSDQADQVILFSNRMLVPHELMTQECFAKTNFGTMMWQSGVPVLSQCVAVPLAEDTLQELPPGAQVDPSTCIASLRKRIYIFSKP